MNTITVILLIYFGIINLAGFILMGADKKKALRNAWRIPEARLFLFAFLGGSLGCIFGMHTFRHKTKHWYFVWGMPAILILQVVAAFFLILPQ